MFKIFVCLVTCAVFCTASKAQTYWVESATVTHSGGWPSVSLDTTSGPPLFENGYLWLVNTSGGQLNPGGLQADGVHSRVDAQYTVVGSGATIGTASLNQSFTLKRENIAISFKVRCSYAGTPPTAGVPAFSIRARSHASASGISENASTQAIAYYIPPSSSIVYDWEAEAAWPAGPDEDDPGYVLHRAEVGSAPGSWTSVGTNLWEVTVTVPFPGKDDLPDQDLFVSALATASTLGGMDTNGTQAFGRYEFRCVSLGGISLQSGY